MLLTKLMAARPEVAEETLQEMKQSTMTTLGNIVYEGPDNLDNERAKALTQARAEQFFLELSLVEARKIYGQSQH